MAEIPGQVGIGTTEVAIAIKKDGIKKNN